MTTMGIEERLAEARASFLSCGRRFSVGRAWDVEGLLAYPRLHPTRVPEAMHGVALQPKDEAPSWA